MLRIAAKLQIAEPRFPQTPQGETASFKRQLLTEPLISDLVS
jgi:hypothetical protein